jgi:hypothetical protein
MIKCLYCEDEFEPKRETAKYCSDSCRVMYNRKHGKKNAVTKFQMQTLYNEIRSMVNDLNKPTNSIQPFQQPETNFPINTTPLKLTPQIAPKSYLQYLNEKRELLNEEQYHAWLAELEADLYLTTPQKKALKQI